MLPITHLNYMYVPKSISHPKKSINPGAITIDIGDGRY